MEGAIPVRSVRDSTERRTSQCTGPGARGARAPAGDRGVRLTSHMTQRLTSGAKVGRWTVVRWLGRGGNGEVYLVTDGDRERALKLLRSRGRKPDAMVRFGTEIETMKACADVPGLLRIVDSHLARGGEPSWFVTDYAQKFALRLKRASFEQILDAISAIGATLAALHARGVAHRDVKPDNLFWCNEAWAVGDLGLVSVPDARHLTRAGTKLGPLHYMAPQMLQDASKADGMAADVYSLSKVLWVMATGQRYPMPGHLHRDVPQLRLSSLLSGTAAQRLDLLSRTARDARALVSPPVEPRQAGISGSVTCRTLCPTPFASSQHTRLAGERSGRCAADAEGRNDAIKVSRWLGRGACSARSRALRGAVRCRSGRRGRGSIRGHNAHHDGSPGRARAGRPGAHCEAGR